MKSESNEGRLLNDECKVIYYSGTENFPKVMQEYCEAMVKRGLGKIMHTSNAMQVNLRGFRKRTRLNTQLIKSIQTKPNGKNKAKKKMEAQLDRHDQDNLGVLTTMDHMILLLLMDALA